jgi:hypothetical protein
MVAMMTMMIPSGVGPSANSPVLVTSIVSLTEVLIVLESVFPNGLLPPVAVV